MNRILKKAGVAYSPDIIVAATDLKNKSIKRGWKIFFGICLVILGVLFSFAFLSAFIAILAESFSGATFGYIFLLMMSGIAVFFCFGFAKFNFSTESSWFAILYKDHLLFKYLVDDDSNSNEYHQLELPLQELECCYILREYRDGTIVNGTDTSAYYMSVHLQYRENDEKKYIILYQLDGYQDVSKMIDYFEDIADVPIYFSTAHKRIEEDLYNISSLKEAEGIEFSGNLKDYNRGIELL